MWLETYPLSACPRETGRPPAVAELGSVWRTHWGRMLLSAHTHTAHRGSGAGAEGGEDNTMYIQEYNNICVVYIHDGQATSHWSTC